MVEEDKEDNTKLQTQKDVGIYLLLLLETGREDYYLLRMSMILKNRCIVKQINPVPVLGERTGRQINGSMLQQEKVAQQIKLIYHTKEPLLLGGSADEDCR